MTPLQLEHLVHLALWMPFAKAVKLLADLLGVQVSEATGRRQTDAAGAADEGVQDEQASQLIEAKKQKSKKSAGGGAKAVKRKTEAADSKLLLSSAGALVPLLKGEWAETKTLVIGEVKAKEKPCKHRPEQEVETVNLSYFSRLTDAETFGERAPVEMERRGVYSAQQVCAVQEGADWIQGFVDLHRPDAVRILDGAHASGYLTAIAELVKAAGTELSQDWLQTHLHALKHQGPTAVLQEGGRLLEKHPQVPDLQSKVN